MNKYMVRVKDKGKGSFFLTGYCTSKKNFAREIRENGYKVSEKNIIRASAYNYVLANFNFNIMSPCEAGKIIEKYGEISEKECDDIYIERISLK